MPALVRLRDAGAVGRRVGAEPRQVYAARAYPEPVAVLAGDVGERSRPLLHDARKPLVRRCGGGENIALGNSWAKKMPREQGLGTWDCSHRDAGYEGYFPSWRSGQRGCGSTCPTAAGWTRRSSGSGGCRLHQGGPGRCQAGRSRGGGAGLSPPPWPRRPAAGGLGSLRCRPCWRGGRQPGPRRGGRPGSGGPGTVSLWRAASRRARHQGPAARPRPWRRPAGPARQGPPAPTAAGRGPPARPAPPASPQARQPPGQDSGLQPGTRAVAVPALARRGWPPTMPLTLCISFTPKESSDGSVRTGHCTCVIWEGPSLVPQASFSRKFMISCGNRFPNTAGVRDHRNRAECRAGRRRGWRQPGLLQRLA
jgi:hypothetical protein